VGLLLTNHLSIEMSFEIVGLSLTNHSGEFTNFITLYFIL
jgi:hypothetical protein